LGEDTSTTEAILEPTVEVVEEASGEPEVVETPEPDVTPPVTEPKTETTIPITAFHGVRDELKTLKGEFDSYKTEHPVAVPEPISVFDDEGKAMDAMRTSITTEVNTTLFNEGLGEAYRQTGDKELVDKAVAWAKSEAVTSPFLVKQFDGVSLLALPRKAVEVYQAEMARSSAPDPVAHDAEVRAAARAELMAEIEAKTGKIDDLAASLPETLTGDSSKGGLTGSDWAGPVDLNAVIGRGG
jgi:hypothetical protein